MKKEKIEEQFNEEAKQGSRFDAATITNQNAKSEDYWHSTGGVFLSVSYVN